MCSLVLVKNIHFNNSFFLHRFLYLQICNFCNIQTKSHANHWREWESKLVFFNNCTIRKSPLCNIHFCEIMLNLYYMSVNEINTRVVIDYTSTQLLMKQHICLTHFRSKYNNCFKITLNIITGNWKGLFQLIYYDKVIVLLYTHIIKVLSTSYYGIIMLFSYGYETQSIQQQIIIIFNIQTKVMSINCNLKQATSCCSF